MVAAAEPRVAVRGVSKSFGSTRALDGVELAVAAGEVHALVGENGAGKSTLVQILAGALRPDEGSVLLDGAPFAPRDPLDARRRGIATVFQELSLAPHLTVEENLLLGIEPSRWGFVDGRAMRARAEAILASLEHEELRPETPVAALSPAARQLVEIGRALAQPATRVLVLDEPTSSLAGDDAERLFERIGRLRERGYAIVYISHFLEEVERIADRVTVLRDGRVAGTLAATAATPEEIVRRMVGGDVGELFPRSARPRGEPVLVVEGLAGRERPVEASFVLRRGEVLGIAGLVGAGRTELLRAVFGLEPVRAGRVRVGVAEGPATPARRLAQGVGLLSEDRAGEGLALGLPVADNVTLSRLEGLGPGPFVLPGRQRRAARRPLDRLDTRYRSLDQPVRELSGGNQQKVALGRLLHHDVDVLLLDEPTRGIDVASKARLYRAIDELAAAGKAVLIVSSYFPELLGVCDRIAVMVRGRLGPARPVAEWSAESLLLEATGRR